MLCTSPPSTSYWLRNSSFAWTCEALESRPFAAVTDALDPLHRIALQTFAGAQEIAGRAIGPEEYAAASRTVRRWASSTEVASAVIVSATYLRQRLVVSF